MPTEPETPMDPTPADQPSDGGPGADDSPEQSGEPDPKAAGAVGWQALTAPGKPDGEVDTRP